MIRDLTVHDAIAGISKLVLEIYLGIKELFIAGDTEVTIDDIKGFLQFPPNLEPEEIISKNICPSSLRCTFLIGGVLLSFYHKFTKPTSDWLGVVNIEFNNVRLFIFT